MTEGVGLSCDVARWYAVLCKSRAEAVAWCGGTVRCGAVLLVLFDWMMPYLPVAYNYQCDRRQRHKRWLMEKQVSTRRVTGRGDGKRNGYGRTLQVYLLLSVLGCYLRMLSWVVVAIEDNKGKMHWFGRDVPRLSGRDDNRHLSWVRQHCCGGWVGYG